MRTIWKGVIAFGEIRIPIGLAAARSSGDISFRTLHRECGKPIKRASICDEHGAVQTGETVKGWEVAPSEYVHVEDAELEALAGDANTLAIAALVEPSEIDPLAADKAYYLVPSEEVGNRSYVVLSDALRETGLAALGRFTAWNRENLCVITPLFADEDARTLVLWTLYAHEDLRPTDEIEDVLDAVDVDDEEHELAVKLARKLAQPLPAGALENTQRTRVRELLEAKLAGQRDSPDLEAALKKSIRATSGKRARTKARS